MFDDRLFFQISAALIPAILFGGLVSGAFRPPEDRGDWTDRTRILLVSVVAFVVGFAVLAEVLAIDLATSPERPAFKVVVVISAVVGAATLAGLALVYPWIRVLAPHHQVFAQALALGAAGLFLAIGIGVLSRSIVQAEKKMDQQRAACFRLQSNRLLRESGLDSFAATDAIAARFAEVLQLGDERVRLRQARGLNHAERKAREASLKVRLQAARERYRSAVVNNERVIRENPLNVEQLGLEGEHFRNENETIKGWLQAFGC